ncbi:MAG TPA: alpha/beta hydrolase [Blastocatellia bacterium]|nr:alpha/beta hydrolase [Blastocatellia bacterium]
MAAELNENYRRVRVPQGSVCYREFGTGAPVVFAHGLMVNGALWRKVAPRLAKRYRCIVPDWPLGSHNVTLNSDADLSPPGLARLIVDFLAALRLEPVTLVGNDTGGALCQIAAAEYPERIARLVLTNCDAFDNFLPPTFRYLQWGARIPGFVFLTAQAMRWPAVRRLPNAFGLLTKRPLERAVSDAYVGPVISNPAVRREVSKVLKGISPRFTQAAATKLADFRKPVLLAWAPEDRLFPFAHAQRLSEIFPDARLERIENSYTFVPEDQPERLAGLIDAFMC